MSQTCHLFHDHLEQEVMGSSPFPTFLLCQSLVNQGPLGVASLLILESLPPAEFFCLKTNNVVDCRLHKRNDELQKRLDDLTKALSNFFEPDQVGWALQLKSY